MLRPPHLARRPSPVGRAGVRVSLSWHYCVEPTGARSMVEQERGTVDECPGQVLRADQANIRRRGCVRDRLLQTLQFHVEAAIVIGDGGLLFGGPLVARNG